MKKRISIIGIILCITFSCSTVFGLNLEEPVFNKNFIRLDSSNTVQIELDLNGVTYGHELLWRANTTGTNYEESAVTYSDGIAYIGSCKTHGDGHDKLFAVNTSNGEILWSVLTGPGYVGPVIDGDVVYLGTSSHGYDPTNEYVYAFNRFTGEELWNRKIYGGIAESIQYDEDKIYFCSSTIYALNKIDGSINWTYPIDSYCVSKPLLKDGAVYFASSGGRLYKINTSDGNKIWSIVLSHGPWDNSITSDSNGRIFLGIFRDDTINCYNEDDGSLIWSYTLHSGSLSFNAYNNGVVFISDTAGYVYAFNSLTGELIWETKIGYKTDISSPSLSNGLLFIGTRDGSEGAFYVLDEITGEILWRYGIGANVTAPPSIADGIMFCGADDWYMYAFDFGIGNGDWLNHRYDKYNTAHSPEGLQIWQYVEANCTTDKCTTICTVTNQYDHEVSNITLKLDEDYKLFWYDSQGTLLKPYSNYYEIPYLSSSESVTLFIIEDPDFENNPPNPPTITGPTSGKIREPYVYFFTVSDPDVEDGLWELEIDFGDGKITVKSCDTGECVPWDNGETVEVDYVWRNTGTYEITSRVMDVYGEWSDWSDPLVVSMPKNKPYLFSWFHNFLEQHPRLFLLLRQFLE